MTNQQNILIVDDQAPNREILRDHLEIMGYPTLEACDGVEALAFIGTRVPGLVLLDLIMPRMNGYQVLETIKGDPKFRDVPVIVISSIDEMESVIRCIEMGAEDYLPRPIKPRLLEARVKNALEKRRLSNIIKDLVERTLCECIRTLTNILSTANPTAFGRATRVTRLIVPLSRELRIEEIWELKIAGMLSQLGFVAIPEKTLQKAFEKGQLSPEEAMMLRTHPSVGADFVGKIPSLEPIGEIIRYHQKQFDGGGWPDDDCQGKRIPCGARMLKLLFDYDALAMAGLANTGAMRALRSREGAYDPDFLNALERILINEEQRGSQTISSRQLSPGMILDQDLRNASGLLLMERGGK